MVEKKEKVLCAWDIINIYKFEEKKSKVLEVALTIYNDMYIVIIVIIS